MSKIRPLTPPKCPDCGAKASLFIDVDRRVTCRQCRYKGDNMQQKQSPNPINKTDPREKLIIKHSPTYTRDADRWALTKYSSAMAYAEQKQWDKAIEALDEAIDQQPDFIDGHIWLARLHLDPEKKRHHYQIVIDEMPKNLEAVRELMVLKGELSREEADRASDMSREQTVIDAEFAVQTVLTEIVCTNCGGSLEVSEGQTDVHCQFCGHIETVQQKTTSAMVSLTAALLKERGKGVKWRVGKHLLRCGNCGAEQIISKQKMNVECPFCGSDHVVKTDALDSFRQPEGIVPFQIGLEAATENLNQVLNSFVEKFKGLFINNRVDNVRLTPAYLPYWVFDILTEVTVSRFNRSNADSSFYQAATGYTPMSFPDNIYNFPFCAVKSPPQKLTQRLKNFDFEKMLPYEPKRLASVTAELYSIDYQQAAIDVRPYVRELLQERHGDNPMEDEKLHVSHMIQGMTFRLVLLPLWVATITEVDKDVRVGLVHGQTGQAVVGKAKKPKS